MPITRSKVRWPRNSQSVLCEIDKSCPAADTRSSLPNPKGKKMRKVSSALATSGLVVILVTTGCVDREKEKDKKPAPEPSSTEEKVVVTPEIQEKVTLLLEPASKRELTEPEKADLVVAFSALGKPGVACLVDLLKTEEVAARKVVIEILGKLRDAAAVDVLIEQLQQRSEEVRRAAVKALGEIGDLRAVPALISTLKNDRRKRVRADAATSLGLLRAKDAVIPLMQALDPTREKKRWVRRSAAEALGLIGDPQAQEALMDALNDKEKVVRVAAMFGLYKLGDTKSLELLEQRAKDADEEVKQWAIRELGLAGAAQSVDILKEPLNDPSVNIRKTAAEALGRIPTDQALDALIAGLQDPEVTVRAVVVEALRKRGVPPVGQGSRKLFDALAELIKNEPAEYIRKKARALYDLIKPTLPPVSPSGASESPIPTPPSIEPTPSDTDTSTEDQSPETTS